MKLSRIIVFAFLCFFNSNSIIAQVDAPLALNSSLTNEERQRIELNSENAAQQLLEALRKNDVATYSKFIPSKTTYEAMIKQFGFKTDAGVATALRDLNNHYQQEKDRILFNFNYIQKQLTSIEQWSFKKYHLDLKENVALHGGRSAMEIKEDKSGIEHAITFYKFYEFQGQWYVTNKLKWQY